MLSLEGCKPGILTAPQQVQSFAGIICRTQQNTILHLILKDKPRGGSIGQGLDGSRVRGLGPVELRCPSEHVRVFTNLVAPGTPMFRDFLLGCRCPGVD